MIEKYVYVLAIVYVFGLCSKEPISGDFQLHLVYFCGACSRVGLCSGNNHQHYFDKSGSWLTDICWTLGARVFSCKPSCVITETFHALTSNSYTNLLKACLLRFPISCCPSMRASDRRPLVYKPHRLNHTLSFRKSLVAFPLTKLEFRKVAPKKSYSLIWPQKPRMIKQQKNRFISQLAKRPHFLECQTQMVGLVFVLQHISPVYDFRLRNFYSWLGQNAVHQKVIDCDVCAQLQNSWDFQNTFRISEKVNFLGWSRKPSIFNKV